jgi:hypothetical protein
MSDKIEVVLELTREEAQGLLLLVGGTHGIIGWNVYSALLDVVKSNDAKRRFPDLRDHDTGSFQ